MTTNTQRTEMTSEQLLMRYAAGALPPYESMMMAAHIALNEVARRRFKAYEAEGGRMVETLDPVSVTSACLNNVLSIIECGFATAPAPAKKEVSQDIPAPFRQLLEKNCKNTQLVWETLADGVAKIDISLCGTEPRQRKLRLLRLAPNRQTPVHGHHGYELTLVLEGSFADETGRYVQGDLIVLDNPELHHSPRAEAMGCICLTLTQAPLRFTDPLVQLMNLFRRI